MHGFQSFDFDMTKIVTRKGQGGVTKARELAKKRDFGGTEAKGIHERESTRVCMFERVIE